MLRQTGSEPDQVLRFPLVRPSFDHPQSWLRLAKGGCKPGAAVVGIRPRQGLQVGPGGPQAGRVGPPGRLGRAHHPLARRPTAALGAPEGGQLAAWTRRRRPGPDGWAPLVHPALVADCGPHLLAAPPEPIAELRRPQAPSPAAHQLGPPGAAPPQRGCDLPAGGLQGRQGGRLPPEQRLVEALPLRARRDPAGCPARFPAVPPPPGALPPRGLGATRQRGEIDSPPPPWVVAAVVGGRSRALAIIPGHLFKLRNVLRWTSPEGAGTGRLLGTAGPPTGPLPGMSGTERDILVGPGLGPPAEPAQGLAECVARPRADGFWLDLPVLPPWGKNTGSPHLLSEGTQTGTPCRQHRMLVQGALLSARGHFLSLAL
jgi:hypothetical protein